MIIIVKMMAFNCSVFQLIMLHLLIFLRYILFLLWNVRANCTICSKNGTGNKGKNTRRNSDLHQLVNWANVQWFVVTKSLVKFQLEDSCWKILKRWFIIIYSVQVREDYSGALMKEGGKHFPLEFPWKISSHLEKISMAQRYFCCIV